MKKLFSCLLSVATIFGVCLCTGVKATCSTAPLENKQASTEEMKKDTELVFIVDKSGSMRNLVNDTIGSFNSVLDEQKKDTEHGGAYVTTIFFNHSHEKIHDRKNIKDVEHITDKDYVTSGCTALLDAVGDTINELSKKEEIKDHKVIVAIITDGYENSSKEYNKKQIKELIESKEKEGWQFVFCGANIDAASEGGKIGICKDCSIGFVANREGIADTYSNISARMTACRAA